LVRECISRSKRRGALRMMLSTQPSQQAAHRVYEALGFVRRKERDWQTVSGSLRWVYSLELS
jgi:ribosomal protein S18 acetylase RimI-like enzyme